MTATDAPANNPLAARWRRLLALIADLVLLWLICQGIGSLAGDVLIPLGDWARLIGLGVIVVYFTWWDSHLGSGASPGKRLLGIHVVARDGSPLSPQRAAPRALLIATPLVLNGFFYSPSSVPEMLIGAALWWVGLPGLMLAGFYLVVFNRRTRQGLHDWLTGALVTRRGVSLASYDRVWRFHLVVAAALLLASAALPALTYSLMHQISHDFASLDNMLSARTQIQSHPGISSVSVQHFDYWGGPRFLEVGALIDRNPHAQQELAARLASQARRIIPAAAGDPVAVRLARGWSLGLTSSYTSRTYVFE